LASALIWTLAPNSVTGAFLWMHEIAAAAICTFLSIVGAIHNDEFVTAAIPNESFQAEVGWARPSGVSRLRDHDVFARWHSSAVRRVARR
jgi:hypothetical protein